MTRFSLALVGAMLSASTSLAADFSFRGTFAQDDDVQLFGFTVTTTSTVTLKTLSYAGGTQADGTVIAAGGFDPILALFNAAGTLIGDNDDGDISQVPADPVTFAVFDTYLQVSLNPGSYTVAVTQFDNFAAGPTLADGFRQQGSGNFTPGIIDPNLTCPATSFCDVTGDARSNAWAFDVLGVDAAGTTLPNPPTVPVPASLPLVAMGLGLLGLAARRR